MAKTSHYKLSVKKKLAKQDFDFLYDEKKGFLYFNENGADKGIWDQKAPKALETEASLPS